MSYRLIFLILLACLLASCAPRISPPVMSAELHAAFQGPLCTRLDGVDWPCSDTDGRLWKQWYWQRWQYDSEVDRQARLAYYWKHSAVPPYRHIHYGHGHSRCTARY